MLRRWAGIREPSIKRSSARAKTKTKWETRRHHSASWYPPFHPLRRGKGSYHFGVQRVRGLGVLSLPAWECLRVDCLALVDRERLQVVERPEGVESGRRGDASNHHFGVRVFAQLSFCGRRCDTGDEVGASDTVDARECLRDKDMTHGQLLETGELSQWGRHRTRPSRCADRPDIDCMKQP